MVNLEFLERILVDVCKNADSVNKVVREEWLLYLIKT